MANNRQRTNRVSVNYGDLNEDIILRAAQSISSAANSPDNQKAAPTRKSYNLDALAKLSGISNPVAANTNDHNNNSQSLPNSPVDNYANNQVPFPKFEGPPSVSVSSSMTPISAGVQGNLQNPNIQSLSAGSNNNPDNALTNYPINNDMINNAVKMAGIGSSETTTEMNIAAFNANREKRIAQHLKRSNSNKNGHMPSKSIATPGLGLMNLDILAANNAKSAGNKNRHDKRHSIHVSSPTIAGTSAAMEDLNGYNYNSNNSNYLLNNNNSQSSKKKNRYSSFDRTDIEKANQASQYLDIRSPKMDYDMDPGSYSYPKNRSTSNPNTNLLSPISTCSVTPQSAVESKFPINSTRLKSINFHTRNRSLSVRPSINTKTNNINILDSNPLPLNKLDSNNMDYSVNSPIDNGPQVPCFEYFQHEYPHCIPVHFKAEKSLLSLMKDLSNSQSLFNNHVSFFGIKNLIFLLVSVNNFGLLLECYLNYFNMTLVRSIWFTIKYNTDLKMFLITIFLLSPCYFLGVYLIEKTLYWITLKKFNSIVNKKYNNHSNGNFTDDDLSVKSINENRNSLTNPNDLDDSILDIGSLNDNGNALSTIRNGSLLPKNYAAPLGLILYFLVLSLTFIVNNMIIIKFIYNPLLGTILEVNTIVIIFKSISYALTNNNLRGLYFRSINPRKYARHLRHLRRFINDDGTVNVSGKGGVVRNEDEAELLRRKGAVMTGMELTETLQNIKQRKESQENNGLKDSKINTNSSQESIKAKYLTNFIDFNLQPKFYKSNYYPNNVSIRNIFYFISVPTMIYQPVYPSKSKIDWKYCFDKLLEIVILFWSICYLSLTYAIPILEKSILHNANFTDSVISDTFGNQDSIQGNTHAELLATMLKVANMSIIIWIIVYYIVFHNYLNLLAELTKFEDREFYDQWWNSSSVSLYWKLWNRVFSRFFEHHIYVPLMIYGGGANGGSSSLASSSSTSGNILEGSSSNGNNLSSGGALSGSNIIGTKTGSVSSGLGDVTRSEEYYNRMILSQNSSVNFMVFLIMATMQEFVVGIPTGNLMGISFICILMQWPLSFLTLSLENIRGGKRSTIGNMIFWISFIVGQPLCILLYFFSWSIKFGEMSSSY